MYTFLPQLPGGIFGRDEEGVVLRRDGAVPPLPPRSRSQQMPAPLVPEVVTSSSSASSASSSQENKTAEEDFSDLVNWATGTIANENNKSKRQSIVLTDDGRTLTEDEATLSCPICDKKFKVRKQTIGLQLQPLFTDFFSVARRKSP